MKALETRVEVHDCKPGFAHILSGLGALRLRYGHATWLCTGQSFSTVSQWVSESFTTIKNPSKIHNDPN